MLVAVTGVETKVGKRLVERGMIPFEGDVTNVADIDRELRSIKPDVIIHCHEMGDLEACEDNVQLAHVHNVRSIYNILDGFSGVFIYLSSYHVFSGDKFFAYSERHKPDPINEYGFSKWGGEILVQQFQGSNGYVVRLGEVLENEIICAYPKSLKRSFIHADHVVDCLEHFVANIKKMPNLLHVGSQDCLTYTDLYKLGLDEMGLDTSEIQDLNYPSHLPKRGCLSVRKANKLGFPKFTALDGIRQMIKESKNG